MSSITVSLSSEMLFGVEVSSYAISSVGFLASSRHVNLASCSPPTYCPYMSDL
jgi:hypothetical protein